MLASLLKFIHFHCKFRKKSNFTCISWIASHPYQALRGHFFGLSSGKAFVSILERFEIKGWQMESDLYGIFY